MMKFLFSIQELDFSTPFFWDHAYIHQKYFPGMIPLPEYKNLEWDEWVYHMAKLKNK
jgi:hypothetical protein